jgi:hypothetical protein
MVIILKDKHDLDVMSTGRYVTAHVILLFDDDMKGFTVIKHRTMNNANEHYHMSYLTNIITAGM